MSVLTDAAAVLSAVAGFPIIKAHQKQAGAPRPAAAAALYGTVQMLTSAATSATPIVKFDKDSGEKTLSHVRLGTLQVDVYGDGAIEAAEALQLSIRRRSARTAAWQAVTARPLVITPLGVAQSIPIARDVSWNEHAQIDFQIQWVQTDTEAMERIETMGVTLEIDPGETAFPESLVDGDMEAVGTSAWTPFGAATLTKETGDPFEGLQSLRVARNGVNDPFATQTILTAGTKYRVTGWAKTDGSAAFAVWVGGTQFVGPSTTNWTKFDILAVAQATFLSLQAITSTGTEWAEFDSVSVRESDALDLLKITIQHTDTPP